MSALIILVQVLTHGSWKQTYRVESAPVQSLLCNDHAKIYRAKIQVGPQERVNIWCEPKTPIA